MNINHRLTPWDKIASLVTLLCFIFWILAKIPFLWDFALFGIFYEIGALLTIVCSVLATIYFLVKWIMNGFTLNKIYLYCFLVGILTLLIMRLVYSITLHGITWMPDYN